MLHGPAAKKEEDKAAIRKSRLGIKLLFIYALIYSGFVVIGVFNP